MISNKSKMVLGGTGIILMLSACMLGGKSSFNFIMIWLIVMGIYNFITALVAEINDKKLTN